MGLQPHFVAERNATTMYEIYKESAFVPIGRGHVRLDCFRIYEAVVAGAVPVVVGPSKEISWAFANHRDPPFLFAESWDSAAQQMELVLKSPTELSAWRSRLAPWYCNWQRSLRRHIRQA